MNHNPNLSLKAIANSYAAFGGDVTFYMMPFTTLAVDRYMEALRKVAPQFVYVNVKTGAETPREPAEYKAAADLARFTRSEIVCDWVKENRWELKEDTFLVSDALTVDIEFHATDKKAVQALEMYWRNRNGNVLHNYDLYCQLIGVEAITEWNIAYANTRDTSMDADADTQMDEPPEDADPQS